jgi:teichuronic acid biosynthesis glycosyltransferase TuaC
MYCHRTAIMDPLAIKDLVRFHRSGVGAPWLRVLFVTSMWPEDEQPHYGTFIHTQAQSLEDMGIAIDVVAIRGYASSLAYLLGWWRVRAARTEHRYDLVHVHTGHATPAGLIGARLPTVVSFVGGDLLGHPGKRSTAIKGGLQASIFRQLARLSTVTITKSREMQDALPASVRARNHVIPNGVNLEAFAPRPRAQARADLGWAEDEPIILFVGDPSDARKNVELARKAAIEVQRRQPNVRLHIGWGSHPSEIPKLMWAADALVFPSLSEGSPNVVKEAMAAALPIVATPVGDIPERLEGVAGCFVVRPDPESFADALIEALSFGRAAAAREVVQALSLPNIANQVADVYERVTGIHRPRGEGVEQP